MGELQHLAPAMAYPVPSLSTQELAEQFNVAQTYARALFEGGMLPRGVRSEASAKVLILKAMAVGVHPALATDVFWMAEGGRPVMYADAAMERILTAGCRVETVESSATVCELRGIRPNGHTHSSRVELKDVPQALRTRDNWKNYPARMLRAMALRNLAKDHFTDVLRRAEVGNPGEALDESTDNPSPRPEVVREAPVQKITQRLSMSAALQGVRNDARDEGVKRLVEAYVQPEVKSEPTPPPTPQREAEVLPFVTPEAEPEPAAVFDPADRAHRDLVTEAFTALKIPGKWRLDHRERLQAYLVEKALPATAEAILAAVKEYKETNK